MIQPTKSTFFGRGNADLWTGWWLTRSTTALSIRFFLLMGDNGPSHSHSFGKWCTTIAARPNAWNLVLKINSIFPVTGVAYSRLNSHKIPTWTTFNYVLHLFQKTAGSEKLSEYLKVGGGLSGHGLQSQVTQTPDVPNVLVQLLFGCFKLISNLPPLPNSKWTSNFKTTQGRFY